MIARAVPLTPPQPGRPVFRTTQYQTLEGCSVGDARSPLGTLGIVFFSRGFDERPELP